MENIIYYYILFFIVFVVRFFKIHKKKKTDAQTSYWETFFVALEIVYSASGIVVALLLNVGRQVIPVVFLGYVALVLVAGFMEMSEDIFARRKKIWIHIVMIVVIMLSTFYTYNSVIPESDLNGNIDKVSTVDSLCLNSYTVIVPYSDHSLNQHVGYNKLIGKELFFELKIEDISVDSVAIKAINKIKNEELITPIFKTSNGFDDIEINYGKIKVVNDENVEKYYLRY